MLYSVCCVRQSSGCVATASLALRQELYDLLDEIVASSHAKRAQPAARRSSSLRGSAPTRPHALVFGADLATFEQIAARLPLPLADSAWAVQVGAVTT